MTKLLDIKKDLNLVNKASLELGTSLKDIYSNTSGATKGFKELSTALKSNDELGLKAAKSLTALGKAGGSAALGVLAVVDAGAKIGALAAMADSAYKAFKEVSGISRTLTFETAVLGTSNLSKNFEYLEQTSNSALDSIKLGFKAVFDTQGFNKFAGDAVAAFAPVEQAAYRLSTVTVASGERSVDALDKNIASMRKLQKATKDALSSVELLNAQYDIASAGFTAPKDTEKVGKASVNLSQAGFGDLAGSTNATVRVLRALGDESSKADLRASQLFETTRVGLVTLDQLTPIIGSLAVQSKQLGVDFGEMTAAVAGLTTQGASAGEAGTRLEALFGEIVNAAPAANKILSEFRDEAGKPIQLNASTLKSKGLRGIVKDIQSATGGDVAKISELFSTKEATEAVQLLISLGDKAFKEYTDRIKNVDTADLGKEAEGRSQTITGAFAQAQNSSQRQVEEFGSGFGETLVNDILKANKALAGFSTGAAEAIGKATGTFSGLFEKIKGVGALLVTAFTTVAPVAIFAVLGTKIKQLGASLKKEAKEGETIWDVVKRKAIDAFADIYKKWSTTMDMVKAKARATGKEIENALKGDDSQQLGLFDNIPEAPGNLKSKSKDYVDKGPLNPKPDLSDIKSARNPLSNTGKGKQLELDFTAPKAKGLTGFKESLTSLGTKGSNALSMLKSAGTTGINGIGKAASMAGPFIKSMATYLGGMVAGLAAGAAALAIATGWIDTFSSLLDKRNNPALQEMAENLKDIKNVDGLQEVLKEFDKSTTSLESTNYSLNVMNEMIDRTKGLWNQLTGASTKFSSQTEPELQRVNKLLDEQILKNAEAAKSGKVGTQSTEAIRAEDKITKGITLNADDETALKKETEDKKKVFEAQIQNQELLLKQKKETGAYDAEGLAAEEAKLSAMKQQSEVQKKQLQDALDAKLVEQQIKKFKEIDTTIPISIQLQESSTNSVKAQIKEVADILSTPNEDIFGDPAKYSAQFSEITKKLSGTLESISVEVDLDVNNAQDLRNEMIEKVGKENFDKIIASNPQFRQKFSEVNKSITSGKTQQAKLTETGNTAVLDAAQGLGSESSAVAAAKFAEQTKSINAQVGVLNEELQRPETSLNRQRELIAEIEQLEASRAKNNVDAQVAKELGSRKQQLTLDQQLLDIKKATMTMFGQESRFASLSITAAQAKVQAAQQELAIKKEQISVANKEELIKKQAIVDTLKARETRAKDQASAGLEGKFKAGEGNIKSKLAANKEEFTAKSKQTTAAKIDSLKTDTTAKLKENESKSKVFSSKEQLQIAEGIKSQFADRADLAKDAVFKKDGTADTGLLKKLLDNSATFGGGEATIKANDVLINKDLSRLQGKKQIEGEQQSGIKALEAASKADIEKRGSLLDRVQKKVEAGNSIPNTSGVDTSKPPTAPSESQASKETSSTTAQDDLNFTKVMGDLKERLGSLAERVALNEAKIDAEYAGREKLIRRGELLGESLRNLASKSSLFADTFAGAALNLAATKFENKEGRLQKDADIEVSKINQKVKDLAQNAKDAQAAAETAKSAGADSKTVDKLETQAKDATKLSETANQESKGDIEFVKQKTALDKLSAAVDRNEAAINKEFAGREKLVSQTNELAEGMSRVSSSSAFSGSLAGNSLNLSSLQLKQSSGATDTKADKQIALVNERLNTFRKLAEQSGPAGDQAREDLGKVSQEASQEIQTINANRALDKLGTELEVSAAQLEKEFSVRNKLIEQSNQLAEGLGKLASSPLLSGSAAATSLNLAQTTLKSNSDDTDSKADKQIRVINQRLAAFNKLAEQDSPAGDAARQDLDKVTKQAATEIQSVNTNRALESLAASMELTSAQIDAEYASRQRLIDINDGLASSFSSLTGAMSSLFKNSSVGASLNKLSSEVNAGSNKAKLEYDKQSDLLEKRNQELGKAVITAKEAKASPEAIKQLEKAKAEDDAQQPLEQAYLKQKLTLDTLTQKFSSMSASAEEVTDRLSKQADVIKQGIEIEDRKRASAVENNKSGTGLQSALVNFLGKNNPVAGQLNQRLEVQGARDDAKAQQAQNVSDAKKEIIDTTLQKSQLDLEQKAYENAITQTALLSDMINVMQGGSAQNSQSELIQKQLRDLPTIFAQGKEDASKRSALLDERLKFIPTELENKQANVKRNLLASELNTLGSNPNGANIDLLTRTLSESEAETKQFKRQDFKVGSLQDKEFQDQLKSLGGSKIPLPSRRDLMVDNTVRMQPPSANSNYSGSSGVKIDAPVSIKIEVAGGSSADLAKLERTLVERTGGQVNTAMDKLSKQVSTYARKF